MNYPLFLQYTISLTITVYNEPYKTNSHGNHHMIYRPPARPRLDIRKINTKFNPASFLLENSVLEVEFSSILFIILTGIVPNEAFKLYTPR